MDGLFVVKNCWTSTSELTVAGETRFVEVEETFVHKGAGDGGTPLPRTNGIIGAETLLAVHQFVPQFIPPFVHQLVHHQAHHQLLQPFVHQATHHQLVEPLDHQLPQSDVDPGNL